LPGHTLSYRGGVARVERYWSVRDAAFGHGSRDPARSADELSRLPESALLEALEDRLSEAVRIRMISDVPLGLFLSGGVDSSLVAGLMRRHTSGALKTFSIGFEESRYSELPYARQVARGVESEHHEFVVRPEAVSVVQDLARQFDEPFADWSAVPTYYVARLARETVTVALGGDGGDELFGGYNWYHWMRRSQRAARCVGPVARPLARLAAALPNGLGRRRFFASLAEGVPARWARRRFLFSAAERAALLRPELVGPDLVAPEGAVAGALAGAGDLTRRMQLADFHGYLPDDVLLKVDRASMLVSLEVRAPLLDHPLCEFAFGLPAEVHTRRGIRKYLAKRLARRMFPQVEFERKQGFSMPLAEWIRADLAPMLQDQLASARLREYLDIAEVDRLRREHQSGIADHGTRLWAVLMFGLWLEAYDPDPPSHLPGEERSPADFASALAVEVDSR
jgi:asparagine synthase (glutamine-hydrolysing)